MIFYFQKAQSIFGGQFSSFDLLQHILDQICDLIHIGIHFAKQSQRLRQVLLDIIIIDCLEKVKKKINNLKQQQKRIRLQLEKKKTKTPALFGRTLYIMACANEKHIKKLKYSATYSLHRI